MTMLLNRTKAGLYSGLLALLCASGARATVIYNFQGEFAPNQWILEPNYPTAAQGTAAFANGNTELDIVGPTGDPFPSYDSATIVGPPWPAYVPWPVKFNWSFNAGDASSATAFISWAEEPGGNPLLLSSGGPGSTDSGTVSLFLDPGDTLTILLDNGPTGAGKQAPSLVITDFTYQIPDATPWIESALLLPFLFRRYLPVAGRRG